MNDRHYGPIRKGRHRDRGTAPGWRRWARWIALGAVAVLAVTLVAVWHWTDYRASQGLRARYPAVAATVVSAREFRGPTWSSVIGVRVDGRTITINEQIAPPRRGDVVRVVLDPRNPQRAVLADVDAAGIARDKTATISLYVLLGLGAVGWFFARHPTFRSSGRAGVSNGLVWTGTTAHIRAAARVHWHTWALDLETEDGRGMRWIGAAKYPLVGERVELIGADHPGHWAALVPYLRIQELWKPSTRLHTIHPPTPHHT